MSETTAATTYDPVKGFGRVRADLHAAWEAETAAGGSEAAMVADLEVVWSALIKAAYEPIKDFDGLLAKVDLSTEPSTMKVDLLGLAGRERDEKCHTRVIASLMTYSHTGNLGVALLRAFLSAAGVATDDWPDEVLAKAEVWAEREQSLRGRSIRPDIIVRLGEGDRSLLVVIENKVDAKDRQKQLDDYAEWAEAQQDFRETERIYLTPTGASPSMLKGKLPWHPMSYARLATAWRKVLAGSGSPGPSSEALRLYLGTITRHVSRMKLGPNLERSEKLRLLDYLRAASGG